MSELSHSAPARRRRNAGRRKSGWPAAVVRRGSSATAGSLSVRDLIARTAARLRRARVFFGHGTDNAWDEAAALVLHALGLPQDAGHSTLQEPVQVESKKKVDRIVRRRLEERIPAAYLTGRTWFAGLEIRVDPRVIVPRSALAELIERRFTPWVRPQRVGRILDLGTGSGCIAIACAKYFPRARVDAVDISQDALEVARANVRRHRLSKRVRLVKSDHFSALDAQTYDIIVSNPPYVGARELATLPPEYRHEPRLALAAGRTGLDSVRVILREAARYLRPRGVLIVEVGNTEAAVRKAFPSLSFVWLDFERGGGGVFLLTAGQLDPGRSAISSET